MDKPTEFQIEEFSRLPGVALLRIRGFVDVNAAPAFERELETLLHAGRGKILVDLSQVTYISSAGIGVFVGYLKDARALPEGDIKIVGASAKLMKVFAAIGLDDVLEFLPDPAAAGSWGPPPAGGSPLQKFAFALAGGDLYCGREFRLQVTALGADGKTLRDYRGAPKLIVNSGLILPRELTGFRQGVWEGEVVLTDSGLLTILVVDEKVEGRLNVLVRQESAKAEFPRTITCKHCGTTARVKGTDIYRCARCSEIIYVDAWAHVITLKPGSPLRARARAGKRTDLRINTDINYLNTVRRFIQGLCEQEGLSEDDTNAVILAVEEVLLNLIEHSAAFDPQQLAEIHLRFQKQQLKIQIRDFGEPFDITREAGSTLAAAIQKGAKGGVGGMLIRQLMDTASYRRFPRYNELTLVKRLGPRRPPAAA